jgi:lactate dehydrogenase-like 2-hydroxyacid dehydrogenase
MGWNVYVTRELPEPALTVLRGTCGQVAVNPHDRVLPRQELLEAVAGRDGILATGQDRVDAELLDAAGPSLRAVANYAVGCDNIDGDLLSARGIPFSNTPDVLTDATADLAWALLLAAARRIAEADRYVREGCWQGWGPSQMLGMDVAGRTLGIVGAGRIGQAAARRATGFGMTTLYWNRSPKPDFEAECGAARVELDQLLRDSDFVSLHLPGTPETRHVIGERELGLMKPTAVLVNTGRGPLVNEAALVDALRERRIAAAGLDVFEEEPKVHPGLLELDNVVLAPHIGSATHQARSKMAEVAATCLIEMLEGRRPEQCVNGEVFG